MSHDQEINRDKGGALNDNNEFGNEEFELIFRQYFSPLCAYCQYKFGFDLDSAKDTVQTGFLKFWETRQSLSSGLSIKAYLYKIITNICLDLIKHEKVKHRGIRIVQQKIISENINDGIETSDFTQLSEAVEKAVSELPEGMRQVFELCRYEGLKYAQVADRLGISIKTVETQMSRALSKLRIKLSDYFLFLWLVLHFLELQYHQ